MKWLKSRRSKEHAARTLFFKDSKAAFEYACKYIGSSLDNEKPVLGVVLDTKANGEYFVKVANADDPTIPAATGRELLEKGVLDHICVCAKATGQVPPLKRDDLVMCFVPKEFNKLNALGLQVLMVIITAKLKPELNLARGWAVDKS